MLFILNANGDILNSIPERVYQGSNNANNIILIGSWASNTQIKFSAQLPNGQTLETRLMTNYASSNLPYDLQANAWFINIDSSMTQYYGMVNMQFFVYSAQNILISTARANFEVERGIPEALPPTPTQTIYDDIANAIAGIEADLVNGWLESKAILPFDLTFKYSLGAYVINANTIYKSLVPNNLGNNLNNSSKWRKYETITAQEVAQLISEHNVSPTAHEDIREDISDIEQNVNTLSNSVDNIIDGTTTVGNATNATNAINATNDGYGTNIFAFYQKKADASLTTADKTVVGGINEINSKIIPATTNIQGLIQIATDIEASAGVLENKAITPKQLINNISSATSGAIIYKGLWNTTNQVDYSALNTFRPIKTGWRWECSGTGCTIDGVEYLENDFITFNQDVAIDETIITSMIDKTDNTETVVSVDGQIGAVITHAVKTIPQTLTNEEKSQAKDNLGIIDSPPIGVADFSYIRTGTQIIGTPTTTLNIDDMIINSYYMVDGDWGVSNAWIDTDTIKYVLSDNTEINVLSVINTSGIGKVADLKQVQFPFDENVGQRTIYLAKFIEKNGSYFFAIIPSVSGQDFVAIDGEILVDYEVGDLAFNYNDGQLFYCVTGGNASYFIGHFYKAVYNFMDNSVSFTDLGGGAPSVDNATIDFNADNKLQAIGITDGTTSLSYETIKSAISTEWEV